MTRWHDQEIAISPLGATITGELDGVPCTFIGSYEFIPRDPSVGDFTDSWSVSGVIADVSIGGLVLDRRQLMAMCGEDEVYRQETLIERRIEEQLSAEDHDCDDALDMRMAAE